MRELIQVNFQLQTNMARAAVVQGRNFTVVPAVLARGVMNGVYYPPDELNRCAYTFNGVPITINHPERDGLFLSANRPDVAKYGAVYNCTTGDGDSLKGELWFDDELLAQAEDGEAIRTNLENEQSMELSTGLYARLEMNAGEFEGEDYDAVAREIDGDHLAILTLDKGACSIEKGCGTSRTNQQQPTDSEPKWVARLIANIGERIESILYPSIEDEEGEPMAETATPTFNADELLAQFNARLEKALSPLQADIAALKANHDQRQTDETDTLRQQLANSEAVPYSEEQLAGFDLPQLKVIAAVHKTPNMAGAGGGYDPVPNHDDGYDWA